jgi:hypothetical protein
MAIWYILWPFGIFCGIWYIFPRFGMFRQEKSGNPGHKQHAEIVVKSGSPFERDCRAIGLAGIFLHQNIEKRLLSMYCKLMISSMKYVFVVVAIVTYSKLPQGNM